jgi:hypothetical protein
MDCILCKIEQTGLHVRVVHEGFLWVMQFWKFVQSILEGTMVAVMGSTSIQ